MNVVLGLVVIVLAIVAWGGQALSWLAPASAVKWGLSEAETDVEPLFWTDLQSEARWDTFALWPMVVAGVLLVADHSWWPYWGLVAGGSYLYFAGRGILTRLVMPRRGFRVGTPASVKTGVIALSVWAAMAAALVAAAIVDLESL